MPLQSREVVTLGLVFRYWEEDDEEALLEESQTANHILRLPMEVRLKILRLVLHFDGHRQAHTRRAAAKDITLNMRLPRILDAPMFYIKGPQEINGSLPIINTCTIETAILKTCKQIYLEGTPILYEENKVVALQSGIKGLSAKFNNYGIPVWGPLPATQLINHPSGDAAFQPAKFNPVMLFSSQNSTTESPFYVCSYKDAADFVHALWIMVKAPFCRGMRYNLTLSGQPGSRFVRSHDSFIGHVVLPWLHTHIGSIELHSPAPGTSTTPEIPLDERHAPKYFEGRLESIRREYEKHRTASRAEPNVYSYNKACSYLEEVLLQADQCVDQARFLSAELLYERVCYEAAGIIRTRTSALAEVSAHSNRRINRVCKLISVSAYRLCELRSGMLSWVLAKELEIVITALRTTKEKVPDNTLKDAIDHLIRGWSAKLEPHKRELNDPADPASATPEHEQPDLAPSEHGAEPEQPSPTTLAKEGWSTSTCEDEWLDERMKHTAATYGQFSNNGGEASLAATLVIPNSARLITTRLEPKIAHDLAIQDGLLALRLPCACEQVEWSLRMEIMLLRLFTYRNDDDMAIDCICRMLMTVDQMWDEAKENGCDTKGRRWVKLKKFQDRLEVQTLPTCLRRRRDFFYTAEMAQDLVADFYGERLRPQKGFKGLVWSFRRLI